MSTLWMKLRTIRYSPKNKQELYYLFEIVFAQMSQDFVLFYYFNHLFWKRQRPTLYLFLKMHTNSFTFWHLPKEKNGILYGVHICLRLFWGFLGHSQRRDKTTGSTLVATWYSLSVLMNGELEPFCISWVGRDNRGCLWVKSLCFMASL